MDSFWGATGFFNEYNDATVYFVFAAALLHKVDFDAENEVRGGFCNGPWPMGTWHLERDCQVTVPDISGTLNGDLPLCQGHNNEI